MQPPDQQPILLHPNRSRSKPISVRIDHDYYDKLAEQTSQASLTPVGNGGHTGSEQRDSQSHTGRAGFAGHGGSPKI